MMRTMRDSCPLTAEKSSPPMLESSTVSASTSGLLVRMRRDSSENRLSSASRAEAAFETASSIAETSSSPEASNTASTSSSLSEK